jgi:hypothetical protein
MKFLSAGTAGCRIAQSSVFVDHRFRNCVNEFGETESPDLSLCLAVERVGSSDSFARKSEKVAAADVEKFSGLLRGDERFGSHISPRDSVEHELAALAFVLIILLPVGGKLDGERRHGE